MKKVLVILFLFVVHFSFAQKLVGVYSSEQAPGIYEYNLSTNKCENRVPIPSLLGIPDQFRTDICHFNGKIYEVVGNYKTRTTSIYAYDLKNKEYKVVYATKEKGIGSYLGVSSTGILYGSGSDSIGNFFMFKLDPISGAYEEYYSNTEFKIKGTDFFVMAKNDNMYFIYHDVYEGPRYLMEFDTKTNVFTVKSSSERLPYMFIRPYLMSDIGDGKIACRAEKGFGPNVFVYDYVHNTEKIYQNTNLKKSYSVPNGKIIRKGQFLYFMGTSKGATCLLSINIDTGEYAEVEDFIKIKSYRGVICFMLNDIIYAFDADYDGMIYGYNLITKKTVIVKEYSDATLNIESDFILVE